MTPGPAATSDLSGARGTSYAGLGPFFAAVVAAAILLPASETIELMVVLVAVTCLSGVLVAAVWQAIIDASGRVVPGLLKVLAVAVAAVSIWAQWMLPYTHAAVLIPLAFTVGATVRRRTWWWALTTGVLVVLAIVGFLRR